METLNKEFWEKRDAAMKRFMASKERKRKRMAEPVRKQNHFVCCNVYL